MPYAGVGAGDAAVGEAEGITARGGVFVGEFGGVVHARVTEGEDEGLAPFGLVFAGAGEGELEHAGARIGLEIRGVEAGAEQSRVGHEK